MLQDTQHKPEPNADDLDRAVERLARERQNEEPLDQGERFIRGAHGAESVEFVWMDSDKNVLSRAAYAADALPEMLAAPEHAALLVTAMQSVDGTTERTLCTQDDLFSRAYVPSTLSGSCVSSMCRSTGERTRLNQIFNKEFAKKMIAIRGQSG